MIEKRTIIEKIEIYASGLIGIRLQKQIVENGNVLAMEYHRTVIEPGVDPALQAYAVDTHLLSIGCAEVQGWQRVDDVAKLVHTPECNAAWASMKMAAEKGAT